MNKAQQFREDLQGRESLRSYALRSIADSRESWTEHVDGEDLINSSIGSLCDLIEALCDENEELEREIKNEREWVKAVNTDNGRLIEALDTLIPGGYKDVKRT